jgi:hypothetical protein
MQVYRCSRMLGVGLLQHRDCLSVRLGLRWDDLHGSSLDADIGILATLTGEEQIYSLFGENHLLYPFFLPKDIDVKLENDERDQNTSYRVPEGHS